MKDLPYYKMWVKDFDTNEAVRLLDLSEAGLFLFALNHAWVNDGLPELPDDIARILRIPSATFRRLWVRVAPCFYTDSSGRLRNKRQEEERGLATAKSKKASESANRRWESDANAHANALPSHCESHARASDSDSDSVFTLVNTSEDLSKNYGKSWIDSAHEEWYKAFWNHVGKADSRRAYEKQWRSKAKDVGEESARRWLLLQTREDRARHEGTDAWDWRVRLHPATWLNGQRWTDEAAKPKSAPAPPAQPSTVDPELQRRLALKAAGKWNPNE